MFFFHFIFTLDNKLLIIIKCAEITNDCLDKIINEKMKIKRFKRVYNLFPFFKIHLNNLKIKYYQLV